MIQTSELVNGLRLVTEEISDVRSVALSFWVGTGSRDESPQAGEAGMSHFLEHLLFKGTERRTAIDIAQAIDGVGGDMNAFTTKECTTFYVRVLDEDVELALDILCDIMSVPAFEPKEIDAERQVVLEEILMRADDPGDLVHEIFSETIFAGHPLSSDILGSKDSILAMDNEGIRRFFEHHYRPNNMIFAAAGHLSHDAMLGEVQERFGGQVGGVRPQRSRPTACAATQVVRWRSTDQAHLVLGVPAPDRHDPRRYSVSLLDVVLGGGMSSRLFQEVRERRGLAYTVYSSYTPYGDAGEFSVYVGTAPERVVEALTVVRAEIERVRDDGISDVELARAKRHLRATTALNLEDSGARMSRIGRSLLFHNYVLTVEEVNARIDAVSTDDIATISKELFAIEPVLAAVGPLDKDHFAV